MAALTLAQMLARLADNNSGQISATDVQEVVQALFERTDGTTAIPALQFDTTAVQSVQQAGHVHWNSTDNTLELDVSATGALQVGFEQWVIGRNNTGSTISDGTPVRITGGQGDQTLIAKDRGLGEIVGVATQDIANNATGRVTTFGILHDLNTSAFSDGNALYCSSTGTLTTTVTGSFVGYVLNANAGAGTLLALPSSADQLDGTTAARPTTVPTGLMYFDTTLGIPIWWNGTAWVNASGVVV